MKITALQHRVKAFTVAALATVIFAPPTTAQVGGSGLTVFANANYGGRSATLLEDTPNLARFGLDDKISSLRLGPNERWEVCEQPNYRGRCLVLSGSQSNLGPTGWNDIISSARRVRGREAGRMGDRDGGRFGDRQGRPMQAGEGGQLVFYTDRQFRGPSYNVDVSRPSLPGVVGQARSVHVIGVWQLCESADFRGRCATVSSDVPNVRSLGLNGIGSARQRGR